MPATALIVEMPMEACEPRRKLRLPPEAEGTFQQPQV